MKVKRIVVPASLVLATSLMVSACASNESSAAPAATTGSPSLSGTVTGIGASSQGSAQEAWIAGFQTANADVTINYDPQGSGAGKQSFLAGAAAFAGTDSLLNEQQRGTVPGACAADSGVLHLPNYISPIAVIFNIAGVDELNLDAAALAGIFKGTITQWNDPALVALNPGTQLPNASITAVHRSDDSGTTENFTDYLSANASQVWDAEVSDTFPYPTGEGAQGTSGVVSAVTNGQNTIGYADASRAGSLGVANLKVGSDFVAYTPEAAAAVVEASPRVEGLAENDLAIALDRTSTVDGVYPLVLVSYLLVCETYKDSATADLVKAYVGYVTSEEGQQLAAEHAGSAPLSPGLVAQVQSAVESIS